MRSKALEEAHKELCRIAAIPDGVPATSTEIKNLLREIVRLRYLIDTVDDHLCEQLRATQTALRVDGTDFTNALMLLQSLSATGEVGE